MTITARRIERIDVEVYTVDTHQPEADGTLSWDATTAVVVHAHTGDAAGIGWTYSSSAAAAVITHELAPVVVGRDPFDVAGAWEAMHRHCRNIGTRGLVMQAQSAVDIALWDLKATLRDEPLSMLLGARRAAVPIYGSGGFTTLDDAQLAEQVAFWGSVGCTAMKIKIGQAWGANVSRDLQRVHRLRQLAGDGVALMVDANGGYSPAQARRVGAVLDDLGVAWFEEPVSSDDVESLAVVRAAVRCDVAAGEYVSDLYDARRLTPAVDCLQLDATRCGGYTGWLAAAAVAAAHNVQVSAHCARTARPGGRRHHQPSPPRVLHGLHPPGTRTLHRIAHGGRRNAHPRHHQSRARHVTGRHRRTAPPMRTTNRWESP